MDRIFTEGARRVLARAGQIAAASGAAETGPQHLLQALLEDESRGAELAAARGLTTATLTPQVGTPAQESPGEANVPQSQSVENAIFEARQNVLLAGRDAEVGTEHLLLGLSMVESAVSPLLERHGLTPRRLAEQVMELAGVPTLPLEVDVQLRWQEQSNAERADVLRILDAAANRAREGLRAVEDWARYALDDVSLSAQLKKCRHRVTEILDGLEIPRHDAIVEFVKARDTVGDVGTTVREKRERLRHELRHVAIANFKRAEEAVRSLEEFAKILSPEAGEKFGQLRYELYTLEKSLLIAHAAHERLLGATLYVLVSESLCYHGSGPAIRGALEGGAGMIQIREKSMPDRELIAHAARARAWTRDAGALLIINDRPDIAALVDADGVHVGQDELTVRHARRIVGTDKLVGVSTHTIEQARQAVIDGADYIGVGPTFSTGTKSFEQLAGLDFVHQVAAEITLPWFAIGGINAENIATVIKAGAKRIAVSSTVCSAEDPAAAAATLMDALAR